MRYGLVTWSNAAHLIGKITHITLINVIEFVKLINMTLINVYVTL